MSENSVTVELDQRLSHVFAGVGAVVGFLAAFAVGPVVDWLLGRFDSAPVPLRLISELPLLGAVLLLTVAGLLAGWMVFSMWSDDVSTVTVSPDGVLIKYRKSSVRFSRAEIGQIFMDGEELVLVDTSSRELSRTTGDSSISRKLKEAFERFGYAWMGTSDPRDAEFIPWVDRSGDLDEKMHTLLRSRRRALADEKPGAAEEAREGLAELGIVVRDRGDEQQYRIVGQPE